MLSRRYALAALAAAAAAPGSAIAQSTDAEMEATLRALFLYNPDLFQQSLDRLRERGKPDVASTLILALRFSAQPHEPVQELLRDLTGGDGTDWFTWMLWQEQHPEIASHPAYFDIKRTLLLSIDQNWTPFLEPDLIKPGAMDIRFEEISWGGVRRDGIPSLDNPKLIAAGEADYLLDSDLVFGVEINGDQRAYPLRIMGWHEMFNDVIGGVPVALAYCTLCGSGVLFETTVDGRDEPFIMGTSGFLYRSNKVMYDRQTLSLWNQFTGKPVHGALRGTGTELKVLPVTIEPWGAWRVRNPGTKVLSLETGHRRDYGSGVVYNEYFASPDLMFPAFVDQTRHLQKDYVFGVRDFGAAKAWPLTAFKGGRVINDSIGTTPLVVIGDEAGRTVRAYQRGNNQFEAQPDATELKSASGTWQVTEAALIGPGGERLPRVAGHIAYWFAWSGYLGDVAELYEG
ncbi:MAG: DUF3179 domain-containing protein [Pseudomonadota bacterium]